MARVLPSVKSAKNERARLENGGDEGGWPPQFRRRGGRRVNAATRAAVRSVGCALTIPHTGEAHEEDVLGPHGQVHGSAVAATQGNFGRLLEFINFRLGLP
jgi:hypothetical protein